MKLNIITLREQIGPEKNENEVWGTHGWKLDKNADIPDGPVSQKNSDL